METKKFHARKMLQIGVDKLKVMQVTEFSSEEISEIQASISSQ